MKVTMEEYNLLMNLINSKIQLSLAESVEKKKYWTDQMFKSDKIFRDCVIIEDLEPPVK